MNFLKSIGSAALTFVTPGGPLLGVLGYVFKPSRMIVWVPLAFMTGSIIFAGVTVKNYIHASEESKRQVVALQGNVRDLSGQVQLERQSVITVSRNLETYTKAVNQYAAKQTLYQQQIGQLRVRLNPSPILEKAKTDEKGATADLNQSYAGMLRMFDETTNAAAVASGGGTRDSSQTTVTTTVTRQDTTRPVASHPKRDAGP